MSSFQPPAKELFTGVLHKCGAKVKSWNKRWMVLRSDYCLYYYKDATKKPLGSISLRDQRFRTRKGERGDCTWPKNVDMEQTIVMVTSTRTYYMFAEKTKEAEEWKKVLQNTHDQLRDESHRYNQLLSGGPSSSSLLSENSRYVEEHFVTSNTRAEGSASPETDTVLVPQDYETARRSDEIEGVSFSLGMTLPVQNGVNGQGGGEGETERIDAIYDLAKQEETPQMDIYEDMDISSQNAPVDVSSPTYEDMDAGGGGKTVQRPSFQESDEYELITIENMQDSIVSTSVKNQPLPPPPVGREDSTNVASGLPLYEDIPNTASVQQPFYEDMCDNTNTRISDRRECVPEAQDSGDEGEGRDMLPPPPLPPKDANAPPLPPKDTKETDNVPSAQASSPIPPMNVTPPSPQRQPNISSSSPHGQANVTPPSPHGQANVTPSSPHRQANVTPPSPHTQTNISLPLNSNPSLSPRASPPSPRKRRNVSPPSPHRTTVTPPPITDREICITPPPHMEGNVTPPSPCQRQNFSPQNLTPFAPQQETKPTIPRPLSPSRERPRTPSPSPKPIPKPRSHSCSSPPHSSDGASLPSQSLPPKMPLAEVMRVSPEDQAIYDDVCFEEETENDERLKGMQL